MQIKFHLPKESPRGDVAEKIEGIESRGEPVFATWVEDIPKIKVALERYEHLKNLIVIGNGGSITTFQGFLSVFETDKKVAIVPTMEPDYLTKIGRDFESDKTLVMPISKSGKTIGLIEALLFFINRGHPILPMVTPDNNLLYQIAQKYGWDIYPHGPLGGRFSGLSATALLPAAFCNIDIGMIAIGGKQGYLEYLPDKMNPALELAQALYQLEQNGYREIFLPIYSERLFGFSNLIVQLIHESAGKDGKGLTVLSSLGPESQHHTNQRFFGGRKDIAGVFIRVEKQDKELNIIVPEKIKGLPFGRESLEMLESIPYEKSLEFEVEGTIQDAKEQKIPVIEIVIDKVDETEIGKFVAFWQYVAYYYAMFLGVDPFNQPQVEKSKEISYNLRKEHK